MPTADRGGCGFPRSSRLLRPSQYRAVFADPRRVGDRYLTVLFRAGATDHARLGLAVSRRVAPRAVDRNRLKRLIRESFRCNRGHLPPVDVVVLPRAAARGASSRDLRRALTGLWQHVARRCEG